RSVPKGMEGVNITKINPGDWVAISRRYATDHGKNNLRNQYKIISKTVFARDLFTQGDSMSEWGYDPQPRDTSFDEERRRRQRLVVLSLSDEQKKLYNQERKRHGTMTPDEWNKLFQSISNQN